MKTKSNELTQQTASFESWRDTPLHNLSVSYTIEGSSPVTITSSNTLFYAPYARAYFNLNCSKDLPQQINKGIKQNDYYKSFQFVAYKDNGTTTFKDYQTFVDYCNNETSPSFTQGKAISILDNDYKTGADLYEVNLEEFFYKFKNS